MIMCFLNLSSVLKGQIFIQVVAMISIYLIVTSLPELVILDKNGLEYYFVAMKHLVLLSRLQNISQIVLYHFYLQSRKKIIQVTPV